MGQRLGKQEPPPQKTISKYTIRLQTAQEVFNDKHGVYVTLLDNMREHAEKLLKQHGARVKELETELEGVPLGGNLTLPSGQTKDMVQSLLEAMVRKSAEQAKEIQRIDEAKDAAGKSTKKKTEFYVPTRQKPTRWTRFRRRKCGKPSLRSRIWYYVPRGAMVASNVGAGPCASGSAV